MQVKKLYAFEFQKCNRLFFAGKKNNLRMNQKESVIVMKKNSRI